MPRFILLSAATSIAAVGLLFAAPASADERRCYTLGVPGQDGYAVCHYLPVDPEIFAP